MSVEPDRRGATGTVNGWSRLLGVSLRPWSGFSPWSLIVRGGIQVALILIVLVFAFRLRSSALMEAHDVSTLLGNWATLMIIAAGLLVLVAVARVIVGAIDLFPRAVVTGRVVQLSERKTGDFLPYMAQRLLFERNANAIDRRRIRFEVVLHTDEGIRQWTVRSAKIRRNLRVGDTVRLTVTPLAGYVALAAPVER